MKGWLSSWSVSLRLARRGSWKARGQSALIVLLVMIPVAAVAGVVIFGQSRIATTEEQIATRLGQTQAQLRVVSPPDPTLQQEPVDPQIWSVERDPATGLRTSSHPADPLRDPVDVLPNGTRIVEVRDSDLITVRTATGRGALRYVEGAVWDQSLREAYQMESGRVPERVGEAVVTRAALQRLGVAIGDAVDVFDPSGTFTVVGTISDWSQPDSAAVIYAPIGTLPLPDPGLKYSSFFLPDLPVNWDEATALNADGYIVWSRTVFLDPPDTGSYTQISDGQRATEGLVTGIASVAIFVVLLLAGAAFAVGARREQRTLALIGSVGARRRTLFQIITANGIVLGTTAGVTGVILGSSGGYFAYQLANNGNRIDYPGFHINWLALGVIAGSAIIAGWIAAIVPAIIASKIDVVAALRGATRPSRSHRRITIAGTAVTSLSAVAFAISTGVLLQTPWVRTAEESTLETNPVMVGAIIGISVSALILVVGLVLLTPALLAGIATLGARSALPIRLGLRNLSRNTGRTTPVVAVIVSMTFIAIVIMSVQAYQNTVESSYRTSEGLPGQGYLPIFSASDDPDIQQRTASESGRLAAVVEDGLAVETLRIIQRPETDWTAWVNQSGTYTEVRPVRPPTTICPLDLNSPDYLDTEEPVALDQQRQKYRTDPRCDIRENPIQFNSSGPGVFHVLIGDAADLAMITGEAISASVEQALAQGTAVSFWPQLVQQNKVALNWVDVTVGQPDRVIREQSLPAIVITPQERLLDSVFITSATARELGITPVDGLILTDFSTAPAPQTLDAVNAGIEAVLPGITPMTTVRDPEGDRRTANWITLAIVVLIVLAAALTALGLSRIDSKKEQLTLTALGIPERVARAISATETATLTLIAVLLGTVGALTGIYCIFGITDVPFAPPWNQIATLILVGPAVLALTAYIFRPAIRTR